MTDLPRTDLTLSGQRLDIPDLEQVAAPVDIKVDPVLRDRVADCQAFLLRCLAENRPVYGSTTGYGALVGFAANENPADQCASAINHLAAGQGDELPAPVVRAAMLIRLTSLCQGRSGVSLSVVDALTAALGTGFAPAVPRLGSLGASGDLVPLAYVARALCGLGHAYLDGVRLPAETALHRAGLTPLRLDGRDALALVNGVSLTAAAGGLATAVLERCQAGAVLLSALMVDILGCTPAFLAPQLLAAFGHPGTVRVGDQLRQLLTGLVPGTGRALQEPYSIRCTPQLLGAARTSLDHAGEVIRADLNGISDNPLFFAEDDLVAHGGNFFGQPVAFVADLLSITAAQLGNLAERQLDLLIDPHRNGGLPPMLTPAPGRQHGVQGVQLAATAMVAALRRAATPASFQSLPTNGHNQDVIPFGTQAALNALDQANLLRLLNGSLAVVLRQAVHVGGRRPTAPACLDLFEQLTEVVAPIDLDRPLDVEVRNAAALLDRLTGGPS